MYTAESKPSFPSFDRYVQEFQVATEEFLTHRPQIEERLKERGLDLNGTPILLTHPRSAAIYLLQQYHPKRNGALVLVQYMRPHRKSSVHVHPLGVIEEYLFIAGHLIINKNEVLRPEYGHIILPKEVHRVHTDNEAALTLIVMQGVNGIPNDNLHIRLDPTEGDKLLGKFVQ